MEPIFTNATEAEINNIFRDRQANNINTQPISTQGNDL